jgi:hypothetical protein
MASATRKQTVRKRDRKVTAKSGTKVAVTPTKVARDEAPTGGESRLAKSRVATHGKEPAAMESSSEHKVPPALPVPIASFTF